MSRDTIKWVAEVLLALVAGYFSLWAALLTIIMVSAVLSGLEYQNHLQLETFIGSIAYFIAWMFCTYIAALALKAAKRGGEWQWR